MCIFSQSVESVSGTNIFARGSNSRQFLVYSMTYAAATDLAMVLPLPVPPNPPEDAVRFINLERYPSFFDDMEAGFLKMGDLMSAIPRQSAMREAAPPLRVHAVGQFEASFVPRIDDFGQLDERFRISRDIWDKLPSYQDYGFAVFKLKASLPPLKASLPPRTPGFFENLFRGSTTKSPPERPKVHPMAFEFPEPRKVHPMALEFPRRNSDLLYFPTVHVHGGHVPEDAAFDHTLYCQHDPKMEEDLKGWAKSEGVASKFMEVSRTEAIVDANNHCWRRPLYGYLENTDTLVGRGGNVPENRYVQRR